MYDLSTRDPEGLKRLIETQQAMSGGKRSNLAQWEAQSAILKEMVAAGKISPEHAQAINAGLIKIYKDPVSEETSLVNIATQEFIPIKHANSANTSGAFKPFTEQDLIAARPNYEPTQDLQDLRDLFGVKGFVKGAFHTALGTFGLGGKSTQEFEDIKQKIINATLGWRADLVRELQPNGRCV